MPWLRNQNKSMYHLIAYTWNNPINVIDPERNCPGCHRLLQLAQRAILARNGVWSFCFATIINSSETTQAGFNRAHRAIHHSATNQSIRSAQNWIATNLQGANADFDRNPQLVGEAGAILAGVLDPNACSRLFCWKWRSTW